MDNVSIRERSRIMSLIPSKDTKPEIILKKALRGKGFSYQPKVKGSPDFISRKQRVAIFLHGCFWHGCAEHCRIPISNKEYWVQKFKKNKKNDRENSNILKKKGYQVVIIWEHDVKKNLKELVKNI
jgi:DNA mismatch endonuclease, patch repair protein